MRQLIPAILTLMLTLCGCQEKMAPAGYGGTVVILMYHRIVKGEAVSTYERGLEDFEEDIESLINNGVKIIDFNNLTDFIQNGAIPEGDHAILTFDDGDISWHEIVRPMLVKYGIGATFFVWADQIGEKNFIDIDHIALMSRYQYPDGSAPFCFESHSFTHPYLAAKRADFASEAEYNSFLDYEMRESKQIIESLTGKPVSALALPYGDGADNENIRAAALRNGYSIIRTSDRFIINSPDADLFKLPGIAILNDTGGDELASWFSFSR